MDAPVKYFSDEALKKITAIEGKTLSVVICYIWLNRTDPKALVELIDNVELKFTDSTRLVISCSEEADSLAVSDDFEYKEEQARLDSEFGGKIKIVPVDASKTKMWEGVPGGRLNSVQLTKSGDNYLSDSLVLDFGAEKRIISLSPLDGLIIDYYEE